MVIESEVQAKLALLDPKATGPDGEALVAGTSAYFEAKALMIQCNKGPWEEQFGPMLPSIVVKNLLCDLLEYVEIGIFLSLNRFLFTLTGLSSEAIQHVGECLELEETKCLNLGPKYSCEYAFHHVGSDKGLVQMLVTAFSGGTSEQFYPQAVYKGGISPPLKPLLQFLPEGYEKPKPGDKPTMVTSTPKKDPLAEIDKMDEASVRALAKKLVEQKTLGEGDESKISGPALEGILDISKMIVAEVASKGMARSQIPKIENFWGDKSKDKQLNYMVWEKSVYACTATHSDSAIRDAVLGSLKGKAQAAIVMLKDDASWKDILGALRIKFGVTAPYEVYMQRFNAVEWKKGESCADFISKLEDEILPAHLQDPARLPQEECERLLKEKLFYKSSLLTKANLRVWYDQGMTYHELVSKIRSIEAEEGELTPQQEEKPKEKEKGKAKVHAVSTTSNVAKTETATTGRLNQIEAQVKSLAEAFENFQNNQATPGQAQNTSSQPQQGQRGNGYRGSRGGRGWYRGNRGGRGGRGGHGGYQGGQQNEGPQPEGPCHFCKKHVSAEEAAHWQRDCPHYKSARAGFWQQQTGAGQATAPANNQDNQGN